MQRNISYIYDFALNNNYTRRRTFAILLSTLHDFTFMLVWISSLYFYSVIGNLDSVYISLESLEAEIPITHAFCFLFLSSFLCIHFYGYQFIIRALVYLICLILTCFDIWTATMRKLPDAQQFVKIPHSCYSQLSNQMYISMPCLSSLLLYIYISYLSVSSLWALESMHDFRYNMDIFSSFRLHRLLFKRVSLQSI